MDTPWYGVAAEATPDVKISDGKDLQWLIKMSGAIKLRTAWKTQFRKKLEETDDPQERANLETTERAKWTKFVIGIMEEANLPIVTQSAATLDPGLTLSRCVGTTRSSTIRKRVKEWLQTRTWLLATSGKPCAASKPESVIAALSFLEKCGSVEGGERISEGPLLLKCLDNIKMELAVHKSPTKKAGLFPVVIVVALELYVLDRQQPRYKRCLAWVRLVKLWTAARFDDLSGLSH